MAFNRGVQALTRTQASSIPADCFWLALKSPNVLTDRALSKTSLVVMQMNTVAAFLAVFADFPKPYLVKPNLCNYKSISSISNLQVGETTTL